MQHVPITQKSHYGTNLPSEVVIFSQSTNRRNIFPRSSDTIGSFDIIASVSSVSYKKQFCEQLGVLMGIAHQRDVYMSIFIMSIHPCVLLDVLFPPLQV